jgi:uncharacterized membrane protein YraQ (UPF0718 family)
LHEILGAIRLAAGMAWQVGWSLVLGFLISAVLQAVVPRDRITAALGGNGLRATVLAMVAGAASSSCSYAAAAVSRTLFGKGAGLVPSLAFLLASTNLVVELGLVLYLLMGWPFMAGEWIGGVVLVAVMTAIVTVTYPTQLVEATRVRLRGEVADDHSGMAEHKGPVWQKLTQPAAWIEVAQSFVMDWSMLWKDVVLGFLIAGALGAFVPAGVWQTLFVKGADPWAQVPANALLGPIVAMLSFVCSIGNVPLAAVLWGSGVSFGGVLAFLFADLIVLPLLDVYRRSYGWKMAAYIGVVFYAAMVVAAIVMDVAFSMLGWVPVHRPGAMLAEMVHFSVNYTFWLNLAFGVVAVALVVIARRAPVGAGHGCACGH